MSIAARLFRHSLVYGVASGLQRLTGFLLIPLYTRVLDVGAYGAMEILATLTNSLLVLASLGLPSAFNKCYHRDCLNESDQRRLTGTLLWLLGSVAVGVTFLGLLFKGFLARVLLGDASQADLIFLSLLSTSAFVVAQVPLALLRARESSVLYSLLSLWQFLVMMALNLWLVGSLDFGLRGILIGSIGASSIVVLTSLPLLLRNAAAAFSPRLARALFAFGLPMIPVAFSGWVMNLSDRWLLDLLANRQEVGLYGLGYRFGMLVEFLLVLPFQLAWPAFYFREAARPDARDIYARVTTWYTVIGGGITLAVALGGEIAVRVMSQPSYWEGGAVIPLVAAAYFLNGFQYCLAPGVHLGGKTHLFPGISLAGAASNFLLNLVLIPPYGMMGAAAATLVSFAVLCFLTGFVSRRAYGFKFESGKLWRAFGSLTALGVVGAAFRPEALSELVLVRGLLLLVAAVGIGMWCMGELHLQWPWRQGARSGWSRLLASLTRRGEGEGAWSA